MPQKLCVRSPTPLGAENYKVPGRFSACAGRLSGSGLSSFLPDRRQYIGQLELLYAVAPYYSAPEVFSGRQVLHFVDNTSACAALVKGYARAVDSGMIVGAFHAYNVGLRAEVFFEYVRSKANIADLLTRADRFEEFELGMKGMTVKRIHDFVLPPLGDNWHDLRKWIHELQVRADESQHQPTA